MNDFAQSVIMLMGIPVASSAKNIENLFKANFRWAAIAVLGSKAKGEYAYAMLTTDKEASASDFYKILYDAKGTEDYADIYNKMVDDGFDVEKMQEYVLKQDKKQGVLSEVVTLVDGSIRSAERAVSQIEEQRRQDLKTGRGDYKATAPLRIAESELKANLKNLNRKFIEFKAKIDQLDQLIKLAEPRGQR